MSVALGHSSSPKELSVICQKYLEGFVSGFRQESWGRLEPVNRTITESDRLVDDADGGVHRRVYLAMVITVLFHGSLLLFGSYRGTYDAFVHIFLGDHYERDWFSTWDQRWYTGFTTVSYPPGVHQSIALLTKLTGDLGISFAIIQIAILLFLCIGVYRFSRLWVPKQAAANAAVLVACSSAIAETVHLFGQLPTTFALSFLLNSLPSLRRWVTGGQWSDLFAGVTILAACTAGHHVTTLFGSVFFLGPILAAVVIESSRDPLPDEKPSRVDDSAVLAKIVGLAARRIRRMLPVIARIGILGPAVLAALVIVVMPYWIWSGSDPIAQIPIPHGSRANFLADRNLGLVFFLIPWGTQILVLPYALVRSVVGRMWPLGASLGLLSLLGTGGTTPVPRMLLGHAFDILTLDRFTFWATISILPLSGLFVESVENGSISAWLRRTGGPVLLRTAHTCMVSALLGFTLFASTLSYFRPFQPAPIDPDPIVAFIEKDQHERWRFMTLGFGDQMAWLSAHTTATQVDGNYHSVRRLPELTSTSVERLEGAKYRGVSGLGSLQQFLEVPEKYHLKFVFSNDAFYDPLLHFLGWQHVGTLENGIEVWERADIEPLPAVLPERQVPVWQRAMWGVVPPAMIGSASVVLVWLAVGQPGRNRQARRVGAFGPFRFVSWLLLFPIKAFVYADEDDDGVCEPARRKRRPELGLHNWVRARLKRSVGGGQRLKRLAVLGVVVFSVPVFIALNSTSPPTPEETVVAYYDDLDFRRFRSAYERLDPETRPGYELWRLQLSVEGGMLASYAKLDEVETSLIELSPNEAQVSTSLRYLTSLNWYSIDETTELVRDGKQWYVKPAEPDIVVPPDQLVRRSNVGYLIAGRRQVTSETTELTDIQDRPELDIGETKVVEHQGLPVVVGEITNVDVDPADITVTAILRDEDDQVIARYNATEHMLRTIHPRETTAFRIDFEKVAAGTDLDFDPLDFTPIAAEADIATVEVFAKAVVTQRNLYRGVGVNGARVVERSNGELSIEGEIRNDGLIEATVPMVLVSYLDEAGNVTWVERHYLEKAIRPQRSRSFSVPIPAGNVVDETRLPVKVFDNNSNQQAAVASPPSVLLDAPGGSDFDSIRLDVVTMTPDFS